MTAAALEMQKECPSCGVILGGGGGAAAWSCESLREAEACAGCGGGNERVSTAVGEGKACGGDVIWEVFGDGENEFVGQAGEIGARNVGFHGESLALRLTSLFHS